MGVEDKTFLLRVITHAGHRSNVSIEFGDDIESKELSDHEPFPVHSATGNTTYTMNRALSDLRKLSDDWTSVAIGFFESVPLMSWLNFLISEGDLSENVITYASEKAVRIEEISSEDGLKLKEFHLRNEEMPVIARKLGKSAHSLKAASSMGRSALAALISEYESFLSRLLKIVGGLNPNTFVNDEDQISLKDLRNYSSIEHVRDAILESRIEDLLHEKSHVEMLEFISAKLGVNLTSDKEMIAEFVEVCQRRHLLMHGSGAVNRRYIRACEKAGYKLPKESVVGYKLDVDRSYLRSATARVFLVGFFTLHIVWQKLLPRHSDESVQSLLTASHDLVDANLTKTCRKVCDFMLNSKARTTEKVRAFLVINRAQSFLFEPGMDAKERDEGISASLRLQDWSMTSPVVKLALACLKRDYSEVEALTRAAVADGLNYHAAQTWSIFREIREIPEFSKCFAQEGIFPAITDMSGHA